MQTMRESWTDERLDDLNEKVERGFERVDQRFEKVEGEFKAVRSEMKEGFDAVNGRIDSMQQTLVNGVIGLCVAILSGFAVVAGLIATQL